MCSIDFRDRPPSRAQPPYQQSSAPSDDPLYRFFHFHCCSLFMLAADTRRTPVSPSIDYVLRPSIFFSIPLGIARIPAGQTGSQIAALAGLGSASTAASGTFRLLIRHSQLVTTLSPHGALERPFRNVACFSEEADNPPMDLSNVFVGFLQPVALGSAAVFVLLGIVRIRIPRRTPAFITRKTSR